MYYNNNEKIIVRKLPKNLLKPNGDLFVNFHEADVNTISDYGFYLIRNDNSVPPQSHYVENIDLRQIIVNKPYADIVRTWIDVSVPNQIVSNPKV